MKNGTGISVQRKRRRRAHETAERKTFRTRNHYRNIRTMRKFCGYIRQKHCFCKSRGHLFDEKNVQFWIRKKSALPGGNEGIPPKKACDFCGAMGQCYTV
ncbi:hypothetical protein [Ruminococcus sp.]|uniref:hypothetical protein n=1 Tax=Ruminococcus sp. TaxID=41978 RepID=UPI00300EF49F